MKGLDLRKYSVLNRIEKKGLYLRGLEHTTCNSHMHY